MERTGWRRAAYGTITIVLIASIVAGGARWGWWQALAGDRPEDPWDWVERIGWITGVLGLPATILFGVLALRSDRKPEDPPPPAPDRHRSEARLLDREKETDDLHRRLLEGPWGIVVVGGTSGVGKSKLVNTVLDELELERPELRVHRHEATPDVRLDVKTLIDAIEGDGASPIARRHGESSLARLEVALEALDDRPVVVLVDCAENLVNRNRDQCVDIDLDEAFEVIATRPRHRVSVVLVTQVEPGSPQGHTWPSTARRVWVEQLPERFFFDFLRGLDRNGALGLASLPKATLQVLSWKLQGNLRLAELVHAVLMTDSGFDARTLAEHLSLMPAKDVPQFLTRTLLRGLGPVQRTVLEALAAYATPVDAAAVAILAEEHDLAAIGNALGALADRHLVRSTSNGRYYLPRSGPDWLSEDIAVEDPTSGERWPDLLHRAANALTGLRHQNPRSVDDLRVHFAELAALMRAGLHRSAHELVERIDAVLREWNCGFLLLAQREELRDKLGVTRLEMANDTALGDIYAQRGQRDAANLAYGRALRHADELEDADSVIRIHANMAAMHWEFNRTQEAYCEHTYVRDAALRLGDLPVVMGALEGLANCHRRWGRYAQAIACAQEALGLAQSPEFPTDEPARNFASSRTVNLALKLARWHAELGRTAEAWRYMEAAEREEAERDDAWLLAACLDGRADLHLTTQPGWAIEMADKAVEQAVRTRDPVILLQARTTLCVAYLKIDKVDEAAYEIDSAARYRRGGRSLVVLALLALVAREQRDVVKAKKLFAQLYGDAMGRLRLDSDDPTARDDRDFTAWDFLGFALCGLRLDEGDLDEAVAAFRKARSLTPPTPGLVERLRFMLQRLDRCARPPGRLRPAIEALSDTETRPAEL
ncbi:tetratricopeptide repeat protein [Nonomuraea aridisoli]|uniref:Novel STAND NTPase 1 domain-containing protein n=1 Tax=Nonomuraea aridisoli TaxID=2070368 RepID=A0A2W2E0N9_9ACTN|nr:tetratricopeptide repeat protein [Nonomuraea aridisoli]PZG17776.1 hypothetical protein C1J01_17055 [Nonomuraea aridisoli]